MIDDAALARVRELRASDPAAIRVMVRERRRRRLVQGDGRLLIIAADDPARGSLGVGSEPFAMADRGDLLDRLARALSRPGVDGVLGTPDIIDDLAALGLLDDRLVVGSMNRGGLLGAAFEMDDRFGAFDVRTMAMANIDAAKTLLRINRADPATASTLEATARVVTNAAAAELPIMIEPIMSTWADGHVVNDLSTDALVTAVAIASGLGGTSAFTWLKLPVVADMEPVLAATTLPTLLVGGDSERDPDAMFASWQTALALPGVRGLSAGRALLYPPDGDVEAAVDVAARLVHPT